MFCSSISILEAARLLSMNTKTVRSLFNALRQCMAEDLLEDGAHRKIGGPGHIIEIDESKFGKRKYNRGRRVVGKWILGGFCRTADECFLVECPNNRRDHHTLLCLIKLYVAPGTTTLTDKWRGYSALPRHGFVHLVLNHSRVFVDPLTGVHTNTCEGMWFHAKRHMLRGHGRTRSDSEALEIALCEFMWRKRHNLNRSDSSVRTAFINSAIPKLMIRVVGCIILLMYWLFINWFSGIMLILIKLKITYTLFVTYYYTRRLFTLPLGLKFHRRISDYKNPRG